MTWKSTMSALRQFHVSLLIGTNWVGSITNMSSDAANKKHQLVLDRTRYMKLKNSMSYAIEISSSTKFEFHILNFFDIQPQNNLKNLNYCDMFKLTSQKFKLDSELQLTKYQISPTFIIRLGYLMDLLLSCCITKYLVEVIYFHFEFTRHKMWNANSEIIFETKL